MIRLGDTPAKDVIFGSDVQDKLVEGVNLVANAVKVTLGPQGRIVVIRRPSGRPELTKDGVAVAVEIGHSDMGIDSGCRMVKESSFETYLQSGDGTTTGTILTQMILHYGMLLVKAGANPVLLTREIKKVSERVVEIIKEHSTEIKEDLKKVFNVAKISSNQNEKIAEYIVEAVKKVGADGLIDLKDTDREETYVEVINGCDVDQGVVHPGFFNTDRGTCEFDNPLVCIVDDHMANIEEIDGIFALAVKNNRPLLIIAHEFNLDVLKIMLTNKQNGRMKSCAVRAPGIGDRRSEYLRDLCALTGAHLLGGTESGVSLRNTKPEHLGSAEKITAKKDQTLILKGDGDVKEIERRRLSYENLLKEANEEFSKVIYKKQLSRLSGGVAIIHVGGVTPTEQVANKALVDDALRSTRSAAEEGVSIGGGCNYLRIANYLELPAIKLSPAKMMKRIKRDSSTYEVLADYVLSKALRSINDVICQNAGLVSRPIQDQILSDSNWNIGFDLNTMSFVDLMKVGVIDATKVQRTAFQNAVSIANMILLSECMITNTEEKK